MLQDEIASLRLEIDAVKNQKQEKEKKYFENTETLQKAMKLKEEILAEETMFQYTGQLNVLRAESAMLNSELENNEQRKQAPETEVESDRSRRAAATPDRGQGQTSQRDLELAFQKANNDWKQKWNPTVLDWLLPHTIMIKVRHHKETWNLPPRKQKRRGYACRTK